MKWSLQQLFKYNGKPFAFEGSYDFHKYIENVDDILDISDVKVKGVGQNVHNDRYLFDIEIEVTLVLEDAVTLEPVDYPINITTSEIFDFDDDEVNLIERNTIDLEGVVWENIIVRKPISVTKTQDE